jgi:hypothetical protein
VVLAGSTFDNAGSASIATPDGRWLVYSTSPASSTENGLTAAAGSDLPRLYNRTFGANGPATITEPGNHLIYSMRPTLNVTADNTSRVYGDSNPTFTATPSGFVTDDGITDNAVTAGLAGAANLTTPADGTSSVGNYDIDAAAGTLTSGAGYAFSLVDGTLAVGQRPITVTADGQTRTYGDSNPAFTHQLTGGSLVNGDTLSGTASTAATLASGVGTQPITQGTITAGSNYALTFTSGTLTIGQRGITVTADDQSRIYGDANPAFTRQVTGGSLVNGDTLSGTATTAATTASAVGHAAISQGAITAGANYLLAFVDGDLTITQRPIAVTADNGSRVYGDANPAPTYQLTGGTLVNGDTFSGTASIEATVTSAVGSYPIEQGTLSAGNNYVIAFLDGDLTITQRPLAVTVDDHSRIYGDANPGLTYQATDGNMVNGDVLSGELATTATPTSDVGAHSIEQGTLANPNYVLTLTNGTLSIEARVITVMADGQTESYGEPDPELTYSTSDLGAGAPLVGSLARTAGANTGSYAIDRGSVTVAANTNYLITFMPNELTITPRALVVTADDQVRIENDVNPPLTASGTGFATGESVSNLAGTLSVATTAVVDSLPGSYALAPSGYSSSNYTITYVNGVLRILADNSFTPEAPTIAALAAVKHQEPCYWIPGDLGETAPPANRPCVVVDTAPTSFLIVDNGMKFFAE